MSTKPTEPTRTTPQAVVDWFNKAAPVGTKVAYRSLPRAAPMVTRTRSTARVLSGHTAVVDIEGVTGCVAVRAVSIIEAAGSGGLETHYAEGDGPQGT